MEPERNIEKALRAFAKKRRERAGDPVELHPANRRLLQDEATRRARKPEGRSSWLTFFRGGIKPGVVYGLCAIAFLVIAAAMFLPALSRAKFKGQYASKQAEEKRSRESFGLTVPATPAPEPMSNLTSAVSLADASKQDNASTLSLDRAKRPDALPSPVVSLYFDSDLVAGGSVASTGSIQDSSKNLTLNTPAFTTAPAASPPAVERDLSSVNGKPMAVTNGIDLSARQIADGSSDKLAKKESVNEVRQRFVQVPNEKFKVASNNLPVLVSFELVQSGSRLRIVDGDGSVYDGSVREGGPAWTGLAGIGGEAQTRAIDSLDVKLGDNRVEPVASRFFRVSGTNRTLNQMIVFAGELSIPTNQSRRPVNAGIPPSEPAGQVQPFHLLPSSLLRGSVILRGGKGIPIQAEPVTSTNR
jgi:hypothetical protein